MPVCDAVPSAPPAQQPSRVCETDSKRKTTPVVGLDTESKSLGDRPVLTTRPAKEYTFEVKSTPKKNLPIRK